MCLGGAKAMIARSADSPRVWAGAKGTLLAKGRNPMRLTICLTAAVAVSLWSNVASAASPAGKSAAFQLNETTWTYTRNGTKYQESIDAKGNYISNEANGKHADHGTSTMKGDKACFTSAMNKEGEICWTTKPVEVGQSMDTVSSKGEKLTVTRVDYAPLSMPK